MSDGWEYTIAPRYLQSMDTWNAKCETTMRHPAARSVDLRRLLEIVDPGATGSEAS